MHDRIPLILTPKIVVTGKAAGSRPCPRRSGGPRGRGRGRSWGRAAGLQQQTFSCAHKTELLFLLLSDHFIRLQHFGGRMFTGTEVRLLTVEHYFFSLFSPMEINISRVHQGQALFVYQV